MLRQTRITLIHLSLAAVAVAIVARAAVVQLWQTRLWSARANQQHFAQADLPAPRGAIFDERGTPLAVSREMLRLGVAPRELRSRAAAARALSRLGVAPAVVTRATDARRAWIDLPGVYSPADAATLAAMRGVYTQPLVDRIYTTRDATRHVVGWVDDDGRARGGLEMTLDSLLRGHDGRAVVARDSHGRRFESPADSDVAPRPGDAVVLTINQELQEISERALRSAIDHMQASGGDIVILDPATGEIRAMYSERVGRATFGAPAVTEPFEPGSTLKPLFAAALLQQGLAHVTDTVNTENGAYTIEGRTIHDTHPAPRLSLPDVIRYSSNIGIVKFVSRMTLRDEYETLRSFGFGMPTGVPFPGEAAGVLRRPTEWSLQSPASVAIGYEVMVTPLQLAAAYGAIANGGTLLQPSIVKAIRAPDGTVVYRHEPRIVRRVVSAAITALVRRMMVGVVEGGTGKEAQLERYTVAGKSGTARRDAGKHGYTAGSYTASFIGLFPADAPQYVIVVKLDDPKSTVFGGTAAAPVSKIVLQAALAARDASLDRRVLASSDSMTSVVDSAAAQLADAAGADSDTAVDSASDVIALPRGVPPEPSLPSRPVPDVRGLSLRAAVDALHRAGFHVQLGGMGTAAGTTPAAGVETRAGTLIHLATTP